MYHKNRGLWYGRGQVPSPKKLRREIYIRKDNKNRRSESWKWMNEWMNERFEIGRWGQKRAHKQFQRSTVTREQSDKRNIIQNRDFWRNPSCAFSCLICVQGALWLRNFTESSARQVECSTKPLRHVFLGSSTHQSQSTVTSCSVSLICEFIRLLDLKQLETSLHWAIHACVNVRWVRSHL